MGIRVHQVGVRPEIRFLKSSVNILFLLAIVFIFVSYYVCKYNSGKTWENTTKQTMLP
jgi:hypothetical protein